ncbi:MAG: type II toxin-antitoxin system RelE/ParE family toxin [Nitrospinae bacterium]|nr:type II toxin-antitoxin system RelE/ParE family toxin [Nitrospinota bacterium]
MKSHKRILREFVDPDGRNRFREWLEGLRDIRAQYVIDARLTRIANGNMGDCEAVGEGVMEFKIHYGPGYRIYFGQEGKNIVILLVGGDKKSQRRDIVLAKTLWREFQEG